MRQKGAASLDEVLVFRCCFPGVLLPMLLWTLVCQAGQVVSKEVRLERGWPETVRLP